MKYTDWIKENEDGNVQEYIAFCRSNGQQIDLSRVNLRMADRGADLSGADLRWANLSEAGLIGADLSEGRAYQIDVSQVVKA